MEAVNVLLEKYNHFKYAQLRSIVQHPNTSKTVTLVVQDDDGQEDLHTISITFSDIKNAQILSDAVLPFLDMASGISLIKEHHLYGFALGRGSAMLHVHNAPLYIIASHITIEEK